MSLLREVRLIPIVLVAAGGLFVLKTAGLVLDGGYTLGERLAARGPDQLRITAAPTTVAVTAPASSSPRPPSQSWASEVFSFPDVTGSVPDAPKGAASDLPLKVSKTPPPPEPKPDKNGVMPQQGPSPGERAVLERLGDRRQEIETRNREVDMRESLLQAAEKRVDAKAAELRDLEERIGSTVKKREEADATRFKSIVSMYESMKAKDAARIFDRLDMKILVEVASQMNPRRLSDVLAAMSSEQAEKLTVELAMRAGSQPGKPNPADLPKIEGKSGG
jgi:flagellar motility protein MotE (MotC chaperone)